MYQHSQRKTEDPNMIYGTHPVLEALRAQQEIDRIYLQHPFKSPVIREILQEAKTFVEQVYIPDLLAIASY